MARLESAIHNINDVHLPEDSVGDCKNWRSCRNFRVVLGNGLCSRCWDRGLDASFKKGATQEGA